MMELVVTAFKEICIHAASAAVILVKEDAEQERRVEEERLKAEVSTSGKHERHTESSGLMKRR